MREKVQTFKKRIKMVPIIIFIFFTLFSTTSGLQHRRRRLHQPFFPVVPTSIPPSQPPSLSQSPSPSPSPQPLAHHQQLPKYPFSTTPPSTQQRPFFPSYHSPPQPPSPSVQSTFPANISSLLFPHPPSSSTHRHVIILAISLSFFCTAIISTVSAMFLYFRSRQRGYSSKTSVSDSQRLFPPNLPPSDGDSKTSTAHRNVSSSNQPSTSSEFLYLGTLVNSRSQEIPPDTRNVGVKLGVSLAKSPSGYRKLGSPELKPLPPLPKANPSFTSGEMSFSKEEDDVKCETTEEEDEEEQFFSPRGSSGGKENRESLTPARIGSTSRRENFGSRSFNSRTVSDPYSHSYSPTNSITSSFVSPGRNLSPNFVKSRFPKNVNNLSISSSSFSSRSVSGDTQNSPDRVSNSSRKNRESPTRFVPSKLPPPPPPPPPPPRFWEIPTVARRSSGHSVLVAPQRADVIRSLGLSLANGQLDKNENGEKSEETPRLKLKPLHWDKVRASSDRAMVWDQLKSSSFQ